MGRDRTKMSPQQTVDGSENAEKCKKVKKTRQRNEQAEKSSVKDCFVLIPRLCACSHTRARRMIIAYLIPGLHLHFYLSTPLPDIVIVCSLLDDFHVLMARSGSVLNTSLNLNWWITYLDFHCRGLQRGVFVGHFWNLEIGDS